MMLESIRIRRHVSVIVASCVDAFLHRMIALFTGAAQREPQHAADQERAKHNRGEGHKSFFAHTPSFVMQLLTPERARHV